MFTQQKTYMKCSVEGMLKPNSTWEEQNEYLWHLERINGLINCCNCGCLYDGNAKCDCFMNDLSLEVDCLLVSFCPRTLFEILRHWLSYCCQ